VESDVDTLELNDIVFKDTSSFLNFAKIRGDNPRRLVVMLRHTDVKHLEFKYEDIQYIPPYGADTKGEPYVEAKQYFAEIIRSQKLLHNENGAILAETDSIRLENSRYYFGGVASAVESWWNFFGFYKPQVIVSILEVFSVVFFINLLFFRKILATYDVSDFSKAREKFIDTKKWFLRNAYNFILCIIYTGYLFFGLRFETGKLKFTNLALLIWVTIQYAVGIVCLAYLANLIIAK
jgi:hypothetical protein